MHVKLNRICYLESEVKKCTLQQTQKEHEVFPDRPSLFQLVAQGGHGSLHALVLLSLTLEDRSLGLDLLDDLIQHSAHSLGLLLLQLKLRLTLCMRIVQLNTGTVEEELIQTTFISAPCFSSRTHARPVKSPKNNNSCYGFLHP